MVRSHHSIKTEIIRYVVENHISPYDEVSMPLEESLVELGVLDSYGVVELVSFLETNWTIAILDAEITKEEMGSINKMCALVAKKLAA